MVFFMSLLLGFAVPDNPYSARNHSSTDFVSVLWAPRWLWWTPGAAGLAGRLHAPSRVEVPVASPKSAAHHGAGDFGLFGLGFRGEVCL